MKNPNWKKYAGVLLSIFIFSIGSVGLTGCESGGEDEVEVEELEDEDEVEVEELEEDELEEDDDDD